MSTFVAPACSDPGPGYNAVKQFYTRSNPCHGADWTDFALDAVKFYFVILHWNDDCISKCVRSDI